MLSWAELLFVILQSYISVSDIPGRPEEFTEVNVLYI